jgi:phospholipid transport system substrate-binding protein
MEEAGRTVRIFLLVFVLAGLLGPVHAATGDAGNTIRQFYGSLLNSMKDGPSLGMPGRYAMLKPVIGHAFDLPYMTSVAVGGTWIKTSPAQQQEMIAAFWRYVAVTYADRFDSYAGQKLEVTGERQRGAETVVDSRIVKSDGTSVTIRYLMHQSNGNWRIADVYLEGTVSELATRRSEFSSILQSGGIGSLITTLNRKADALAAGP